jgi:SAM-dependent methyltransferase
LLKNKNKTGYENDYYQKGVVKLSGWVTEFFYKDREKSLVGWDKSQLVVEIGYGNGQYLAWLKSRGWKVEGIERDDWEKWNKIEAKKTMFLFYHSWEHVANPEEVIEQITRNTTTDSEVIIRLPVSDSWEFKMAKDNWFHCDPLHHEYVYSTTNLIRQWKSYGWKLGGIKYGIPEFRQVMVYSWWSWLTGRETKDREKRWLWLFLPLGVATSMIMANVFKNSGVVEVRFNHG